MAISVPENLVLAASATGSLPLADIKYIKGAFKVFETAAEMQNVIVEQVTDNQIVWLEASSSLYQATINPANPPISFFPTVTWNSFSFPGGGGSVNTGSLMTTASAALNVLTFTKGNGDQFSVTIDTGSGGSGTPGSPANSVQFNDAGSFGGDSKFLFNKTTGLTQISGSFQITSSVSDDVFIIKSGDTDLFKVQNNGVVVFASQSSLPTAVEGGMVYSASAFYVGVE